MLESVRVRLTLWYTVVLAFVLICLALLTYFLYWRNTSQRTDEDIKQLSEAFITTFNAELEDESGGADAVKNAAQRATLEHRFRDTYFVLLDSSGNVLQSSIDSGDPQNTRESLPLGAFSAGTFHLDATGPKNTELHTIGRGKHAFRSLASALSAKGSDYTLIVLQSLRRQRETMEDIRDTFLWAIPLGVLLASFGGYFLAKKSLAPIAAMTSQAKDMGAANLDRRLSVANERDELGQLAQTFNQLLARLEASFEQQRRFMADASHELRTPIAILRGEAEVTLSNPQRSPDDYRETLSILGEESRRLAQIIEDLFTLARADAGQYPLTLRDTYLDELASEALVRTRSLALSKNITLLPSIESNLPIRADEDLLSRMLLNLLDNAIKYSPPGSTVTVGCRREGDRYLVTVADTGPGIPVELQPRIFERFFRADKARSRSEGETGGAGLGLSITRWIVEAHHGQLALSCSDGSGTTFTATLPVNPQV